MENGNPTAGDSDATTADPIDRIQSFLDAEDGDSTQDEPAQNATGDTDKPDDDAQADDQQPQITTSQLAAFLGLDESEIDVDEDGSPVFKTKIDGKEATAKFADIRKTYQLSGHADNRAREAAELERAANARMQEADQAVQARFAQVDQGFQQAQHMAAVAREALMEDYNAINWRELEAQDPGNASLLHQKFQMRMGRINGALQNLDAQRAQHVQAAQQQAKQAETQHMESEAKRMKELIPEWRDTAVMQSEVRSIQDWALANGYRPDELNLRSAAQVKAIRTAWQHSTLQQRKPAIENKVRTAPKLIKPGVAQQKGDTSNTAVLKSLKQQVRSTGGSGTKALTEYLIRTGKA